LRLRSGLFSTVDTEMSPNQRFPFNSAATLSPIVGPDCHLVHTAIPSVSLKNSLGVFPNSLIRFLASFAKVVSNCISVFVSANTYTPDHYPPNSLKAGYAVHSTLTEPHNRFTPFSWSKGGTF